MSDLALEVALAVTEELYQERCRNAEDWLASAKLDLEASQQRLVRRQKQYDEIVDVLHAIAETRTRVAS